MKVLFILGTRPEAIKLAPIILALKKINKLQTILVSTGQHDLLLQEALAAFNLEVDINFAIMRQRQTLAYILSQSLIKVNAFLDRIRPNLAVVQGDSSSALAGALASFYHKIPVVHIEAGCRTQHRYEPFPEEINRRLIASLATWHFPATKTAFTNLIRENINKKRIFLVGSTEADASAYILNNSSAEYLYRVIPDIETMKHIIVITTHRRESWGKPLAQVFSALHHIATHHPKINFIYSIHPNPLVMRTAMKELSGLQNLKIIPHIPTIHFVQLIKKASLIMTDSGGVQLQAGALLKPIMILRDVTEWPELIDAGIGRLIGTDKQAIISTFAEYIANVWPHKIPKKPIYPKGASDKIVKIISTKILT